ncbi:MAG: type II toxin-antitoxin system VapC family toxin [Thermodesulfobacteriota bacterium]
MDQYVVDASIILKWVVGDELELDYAKARHLLEGWMNGRWELAAPTLWTYEVGNFLGRQVPEEAAEKISLLLDLKIRNIDLDEGMCRRCFTWMQRHGVTFYDAAYLAVAFELPGRLITADEKFVGKMPETERLCLLKDLELP